MISVVFGVNRLTFDNNFGGQVGLWSKFLTDLWNYAGRGRQYALSLKDDDWATDVSKSRVCVLGCQK